MALWRLAKVSPAAHAVGKHLLLGWVVASSGLSTAQLVSLCTTGITGRSLFKDGFLSHCRWQSEPCTIGTTNIS